RTLAERYRNIMFSQLPKTFQDAVQITRALGFRFLWIDSICIIQDDKTDWEIESAKMAGIYIESCVTIAATASVNSDGGFFFSRSTRPPWGSRADIETFEFQQTFGDSPRFPGVAAPLLQRAWAYQERIMAPRILHVNTDEMFWECKHCTLCECGYLSWHREQSELERLDREGPFLARPPSTLKSRIARATHPDTPIVHVQGIWQNILRHYHTLALTKESDRLPALSGLASFLSQKLRTRYLAGLWEDNLAVELLWQRERSATQGLCSRNRHSNLPSWSWASIVRSHSLEDNIHLKNHICNTAAFGSLIKDDRLKILHADCKVLGNNPFGEVSGGTISIRGAFINTKLHLKRESAIIRSYVVFQSVSESNSGSEVNDVHLDILGPDEPVEVFDGEILSCMLFGKQGSNSYNRGIALVLKAVGADTCQRVGVVILHAKNIGWWYGVVPATGRII
ncbi:HET-domain-containing protein, partial [Cadophora sp. DSE1049]